ncbi:VOC family protein [Hansschlegelia zhihuaiae]|uniref:Aldoketomutase n=1 Tax=Hansschlegelia zhihuaiae TaxID=405005 RepID=A0A4Q0M9W2_9HYPH|nr:VOC family protein [Hansschlegelia zhihuaiae]RXF69579.1 lactoylglutathione lyase [Hansschlegelia zhihuaiae]
MAKMIHSMVRVTDEKRSIEFYGKAFGLKVADRYPFESFTLVYLRNEETGFELELTVNAGRDRAYDLGDGYGHLALSVDDVDAEHERMVEAGLKPNDVKTMQRDGTPFARFFFISDPDGYKIEVLQRGGRFL